MQDRVMPKPLNLGEYMSSVIYQPMYQWEVSGYSDSPDMVMGYKLPTWQRAFVWTEDQQVKLIESVWLGINIGTYTFNRNYKNNSYNDLLIDGQQRLRSIQNYMSNQFKVFGYFWKDVSTVEKRGFSFMHFHCYITSSNSDNYLRNYYNTVNFSGTSHKESEMA